VIYDFIDKIMIK